jgi:hypothetical protein
MRLNMYMFARPAVTFEITAKIGTHTGIYQMDLDSYSEAKVELSAGDMYVTRVSFHNSP